MKTPFDYIDLKCLMRTAQDFSTRYPEHNFSEDETCDICCDIYCDVYDTGFQTAGALILAGILSIDHPKLAYVIVYQSQPAPVEP
jgi:hypothetical protein